VEAAQTYPHNPDLINITGISCEYDGNPVLTPRMAAGTVWASKVVTGQLPPGVLLHVGIVTVLSASVVVVHTRINDD